MVDNTVLNQELITVPRKATIVLFCTVAITGGAVITSIQASLYIHARKFNQQEAEQYRSVHGRQAEIYEFQKRQLKIMSVASIVILSYLICFIPITVTLTGCVFFHNTNFATFEAIAGPFTMLNACLNPVIYGVTIKFVRTEFCNEIQAALQYVRNIKSNCMTQNTTTWVLPFHVDSNFDPATETVYCLQRMWKL